MYRMIKLFEEIVDELKKNKSDDQKIEHLVSDFSKRINPKRIDHSFLKNNVFNQYINNPTFKLDYNKLNNLKSPNFLKNLLDESGLIS